jgi:hypothetical protein
MSWNYNVADLGTNQKDQIRFLIGDTNTNDQQLQDEELQFSLTIRSSIWGAAATCCESISANLSRKADTTTGELRTLYSSLSRAYHARSMAYESKSVEMGGALPFAGGISIAQKILAETDPDRVQPAFSRGLQDNLNYPISPAGNEPSVPADGRSGVV